MPSALFSINGDATNQGFDGVDSEGLSFALRSPNGVGRWELQVFDAAAFASGASIAANPPRQSTGATELVLNNGAGGTGQRVTAASVASTIETALPAGEVSAWIIRSIVNNGVTPEGRFDPSLIAERMVVILDANGNREVPPTERTQYHDDGWTQALRGIRANSGGGGGGRIADFDRTGDPVFLHNFAGNWADESGYGFDLSVSPGNPRWRQIQPGVLAAFKAPDDAFTVGAPHSRLQIKDDLTIHIILTLETAIAGPVTLVSSAPAGSDSDPQNNSAFIIDIKPHPSEPGMATVGMFWEEGAGQNVAFELEVSNPELGLALTGEPFMLTARRAGGVGQFFLNGLLWGAPSSVKPAATGGENGILIVGGKTNSTSPVPFTCKGVKIHDFAQSDSEIEGVYNQAMGPAYGELPSVVDAPAPALGWSHNDELQTVPLVDALTTAPPFEGFEVDVHLVSGELRTGHTLLDTLPGVTLSSVYLAPIDALPVAQHPQVLSVDFKTTPSDASFAALLVELAAFPGFADGHMRVICTGFRPVSPGAFPGYVSFSGTYSPSGLADPDVTQLIFNWLTRFSWNGVGVMPPGERRELEIMVTTCNLASKELRPFFNPESVAAWETLRKAGVHWIAPGGQHPPGADNISALAAWRATL